MSITMIGLDIAKSVFQLHAIDATGKVQLKRKLRRERADRLLRAAAALHRGAWRRAVRRITGPACWAGSATR